MSARSHTPGPWIAEGSRIYTNHVDRDLGQVFLARVSAMFGDEQGEADAVLMAASPVLLNALVGLMAALQAQDNLADAFEAADAAIAMATQPVSNTQKLLAPVEAA